MACIQYYCRRCTPDCTDPAGERKEEIGTERENHAETVLGAQELDTLEELSEYLEVLSNSARLRILKLVEQRPRDARSLSHEIGTSYENTKKHLDRLLSIGVIRKDAGLGRQTSKGVHPVWEYSLVPGALEAIIRNLAIFSNTGIASVHAGIRSRLGEVRGRISEEFGGFPALVVMGGAEDGRVCLVRGNTLDIGRVDPDSGPGARERLVLHEEYRAVTRVSRPHARITRQGDLWQITDAGSTGGTFVNGRKLEKGERIRLEDGAMIELAKGPQGARLLFVLSPKFVGGSAPEGRQE